MFPPGQHPIYKYTEEDRRTVLENSGITEEQLKTDAEAIQTWARKQPHLAEVNIDTHLAEMYIIMAKGSVERAKQRLDFYLKVKQTAPEIQGRIKVLDDLGKPVFSTHIIAPAPKLYKGTRITYLKMYDYSNIVQEMCVTAAMLFDVRYHNDFWSDEIWIFDLKNLTFATLLSINFAALSRGYWIMKEGLGIRIKQVLVVNCSMSNIAQTITNVLKHFVSEKVLGRLQFFETDDKLKEYFPKEYLPKDYGGILPSLDAYKDKMQDIIANEKTRLFLLNTLEMKSNESKRLKLEYDENHLNGHFKKLDID